jgi:hypothetical protein
MSVLVILAVLAFAGPAWSLPGDLTVEMELEEQSLEAQPTESSDTVIFHGNVTFDQSIWQYASATMTATLDRNWTVSVNPQTVTHRGPGTRSFTVSVEVPPTARGGEVTGLDVVAQFSTRFGSSQSVSETATVSVANWHGYRINRTGPVELVLMQGTNGVLRVPLRNVGNTADSFTSTVPYWYGLRPLGIIVESPSVVSIPLKDWTELEFTVSVTTDAVPRTYVFDLVIDSAGLPSGGQNATEDPRTVRAEVFVTGVPPPDDPYDVWEPGDPPDPLSRWESVFGASARRNNPDVDPSGLNMVYDQFSGGDRVIYIANPDGSSTTLLTNAHNDHHPIISPNGQMVAFARAPDRIIIVNHNGTELMEFGTDFGWVNLTDWSPSGDKVLFDAAGDIYELDLRYNSTRRLAGEPVEQWGAVYSPDGTRVYYLSFEAAGVNAEVWSMTSSGSAHNQLTFNDLAERTASISPNGKRIAFSLEETNQEGDRVCVMDLDGSDVRFFTYSDRDVFVLRWLPKGDTLLAEVSSPTSTSHDIEQVGYPWKDAGASDDGGGGGNGGGGGGSSLWDDVMGWFTPTVVAIILLLIVAAIGGNIYRRRKRLGRQESADEIRRQMELEERQRWEAARRNAADDWGHANVRASDYQGTAWDHGDVIYPP